MTSWIGRSLSRSWYGVLAVVVVSMVGWPPASAAPAGSGSTWRIVASPSKPDVGQSLVAVTAVSASDAWAVGDVYDRATGEEVPLTQHWNGRAWSVVPTPAVPHRYHRLQAVAAASATDVWAMGYTIDDFTYEWHALVLHWNGAAWSIVPQADPGVGFSDLTGVVARSPSDVWAAGYAGSSQADFATFVEHWDGSNWARVATPSPGVYAALSGLSFSAADDGWATGYYREGNDYETLALHWDGSAWAEVETPNRANSWLSAVVAVAGDDVWATGYSQLDSAKQIPLVEHWDGTGWTISEAPGPLGFYNNLSSVAEAAPNALAAAGTVNNRGEYRPFVVEYDGSAWTRSKVPEPPGRESFLYGVAPDGAGGFWAVGYSYTETPLTFRTYVVRSSPAAR